MNETPISAKVIADSISIRGCRMTTMMTTYPRFVHAEHLRHRMFSFNVASSRAIPVKKFRTLVADTPCMPVWWGKNEPGMQANTELEGEELRAVQEVWQNARNANLLYHVELSQLGLHKQIANRILEAWMPVTVLFSGTEWKNFFKLRCHPAAQPEMQAVADCCLKAYVESTPQVKNVGEWHLPFGDQLTGELRLEDLKKVCVARCARLSYLTHDKEVDYAADIFLHDKLAVNGHWSPFEHLATPEKVGFNGKPCFCGNLYGWVPYRKLFPMENGEELGIDLVDLLKQRREAGSKYAQ